MGLWCKKIRCVLIKICQRYVLYVAPRKIPFDNLDSEILGALQHHSSGITLPYLLGICKHTLQNRHETLQWISNTGVGLQIASKHSQSQLRQRVANWRKLSRNHQFGTDVWLYWTLFRWLLEPLISRLNYWRLPQQPVSIVRWYKRMQINLRIFYKGLKFG